MIKLGNILVIMKKIILGISAALLLGGCVASPYYYEDQYRAPVRYAEPCCYNSNITIIRSGGNMYAPRPYYRPYRYERPQGAYRPPLHNRPQNGHWGGNGSHQNGRPQYNGHR